MNKDNIFNVLVDSNKNRIYISITGVLDKYNINKYNQEILTSLDEVEEGYTVLMDLLKSKGVTPEIHLELDYVKSEALSKNLKGLATVTNNVMMKSFSNTSMKELKPRDFNSVEEAEDYLDSL